MKNHLRRFALILLVIVFVISSGVVIRQFADSRKGSEIYLQAEMLAGLAANADILTLQDEAVPLADAPADEDEPIYRDHYAEALASTDLAALRRVNERVVGWMIIPGTGVSFPVVQGDDNSYYLNHAWTHEISSLGAIFLECTNAPDFSEFSTIIYGHRMRNGAMFGGLHNYSDIAYWQDHPSIYIIDDTGVHRYDIYAAYEVPVTAVTYRLYITEDETKQEYISFGLDNSTIDTGLIPTEDDRIITLSTCTGNGHSTRWVVQAVLRDGVAPPSADTD